MKWRRLGGMKMKAKPFLQRRYSSGQVFSQRAITNMKLVYGNSRHILIISLNSVSFFCLFVGTWFGLMNKKTAKRMEESGVWKGMDVRFATAIPGDKCVSHRKMCVKILLGNIYVCALRLTKKWTKHNRYEELTQSCLCVQFYLYLLSSILFNGRH